jgi:cytochrome d ubiquinol oxidase subunit I
MDSALLVHRIHFAFTVTFHYLFPQLTMGLAPLIVVLKTLGLRRNDETYHQAARFWAKIFGINFLLGVVTGIPMEFQFGTNWSHFSRYAGGVIGQTLAMEGMFAFFLESAFLGLFLYGEKRLSPRAHWWSAVAVFLGSWLFHHRHRCMDATPRRLCESSRWLVATLQLLGARLESLGLVAVCP